MKRKPVNTWQRKLLIYMLALLALTLLACATSGLGGKVPPPTLEHGWSVEMEMEINQESKQVKCMTLEDIRKIDIWAELMGANQEVGR